MYTKLCTCICLFVVVTVTTAYICPLPSLPCRLGVVIKSLNGSVMTEANTDPCTCTGRVPCPSDWGNNTHVIRRKLLSLQHKITLKMMFCSPIRPQNICRPGDVALVVEGNLHIPNSVKEYNCRCTGQRPLHLHSQRYTQGHLIEQSYVCAAHMPYCSTANNYNATCMSIGQAFDSSYPCRCRKPRSCQQGAWPDIRGTCQTPHVIVH